MFCDLPAPARGLSLSSHKLIPSHAQILFEFSNKPEALAMIPQDNREPQLPLTCKKNWNKFDLAV